MVGQLVGYARVSSSGQSLEVQLDALTLAGCEKVFAEKRSGTTTSGRSELVDALSYVREGDTLVVTRLDRLARSAVDLHSIVAQLTEKGVAFQCLQQSSIDTRTSTGKLLLGVLASIAEFETDIRRERQREGIERAKAAGVYKGRRPTVDVAQVRALRDQGLGGTEIAKQLGIGRASVYRALAG
ncbi:recombinase family protein [Altererythrobacter sp. C41]|uniref:recombinase family protein n=1 Tax=Altererythrobacter sp. C41 TaxID=2806021 RepID=UPI0019329162|nr:recombinase family protein [Altererythrobacter sp. C41]MBM0169164.1 recombinase family protein [Altererythrobacter sp. C41]